MEQDENDTLGHDTLEQQWINNHRFILYWEGIDWQILAALCHTLLPETESIDLINVVCCDNVMLNLIFNSNKWIDRIGDYNRDKQQKHLLQFGNLRI